MDGWVFISTLLTPKPKYLNGYPYPHKTMIDNS